MSEYILILLNERSRTDFLDDFQKLIHSFSSYSIVLYFTPSSPEIEASIPFSFKQYQGDYPGKFPVMNEVNSLEKYKLSLLVNLSGLEILDEQLRNIPEIKSSFFSQLYMQYCPALIQGIISQHQYCTFQVSLNDASNKINLLTEGTFKLLNYDYKKALELVFQGNLHLLSNGIKFFLQDQIGSEIPEDKSPVPINPSQLHLLKRRLNQNKFKHRFRQLFFYDRWNVGIIDASFEEVALHPKKQWAVKWFKELDGSDFIGDPFGCEINGESIIFFENYLRQKGEIWSKKNASEEKMELSLPVHLSYPYTIYHEEIWYCIPEQSKANKVEIYQINPTTFALEKPIEILSHFNAVDPSIIFKDGKWYLFCTDARDKGADIRLHIFIADTLTGTYRPHKKNPVKTDIRSARCGGEIFSKDGIYYRPSQDSSHSYGKEIIIQRINKLNENEYSETEVHRLSAHQLSGKYNQGWHTISSLGSRTLIDGKRKVLRIRNFFQKIRKK